MAGTESSAWSCSLGRARVAAMWPACTSRILERCCNKSVALSDARDRLTYCLPAPTTLSAGNGSCSRDRPWTTRPAVVQVPGRAFVALRPACVCITHIWHYPSELFRLKRCCSAPPLPPAAAAQSAVVGQGCVGRAIDLCRGGLSSLTVCRRSLRPSLTSWTL